MAFCNAAVPLTMSRDVESKDIEMAKLVEYINQKSSRFEEDRVNYELGDLYCDSIDDGDDVAAVVVVIVVVDDCDDDVVVVVVVADDDNCITFVW